MQSDEKEPLFLYDAVLYIAVIVFVIAYVATMYYGSWIKADENDRSIEKRYENRSFFLEEAQK